MRLLALFLLLASVVYAGPREQCMDFGGTWSNFKGRCDLTHKHFFKDKQTWAALGVIGASVLIVSLSANHVKDGGTFLFGGAGNATTSADIALAGTATFALMLGFQRVNWYLGHDDPSLAWREISYWLIPGLVSGATAAEMAGTNWGHKAGPFPAPLPQIRMQQIWLHRSTP